MQGIRWLYLFTHSSEVQMRKLVFLFILFSSVSISQGIVSAHYDIKKQSAIYSFVYAKPIGGLFLNGFAEVWHTPNKPDLVYPANKWVVQSKHWLSVEVAHRLSVSTEVQVMYNLPDAWATYPDRQPFSTDKWSAFPKIGFQYRVW